MPALLPCTCPRQVSLSHSHCPSAMDAGSRTARLPPSLHQAGVPPTACQYLAYHTSCFRAYTIVSFFTADQTGSGRHRPAMLQKDRCTALLCCLGKPKLPAVDAETVSAQQPAAQRAAGALSDAGHQMRRHEHLVTFEKVVLCQHCAFSAVRRAEPRR